MSAALDELFSAVDINQKIGTTDISAIGDGTITGALSTHETSLSTKTNVRNSIYQGEQAEAIHPGITSLSAYGYWKTIGTANTFSNSINNLIVHGTMVLNGNVSSAWTQMFQIVGSASSKYLNLYYTALTAMGLDNYTSIPVTFTNVTTGESYIGILSSRYVYVMNLPAGTYEFSFSITV